MAARRPLVWLNSRYKELPSGDTIAHTLISGLGTVVTYNTGTSGATVPVCNGGTVVWASGAEFGGALKLSPTSVLGGADGYLWWDSTDDTFKCNFSGSARTMWHSGNILDIGTTGATARSALSLGTAATQNTGTSGATLGFLNGNNTHSGNNTNSGNNTHSGINTFTNSFLVGGTRTAASTNSIAVNPTIDSTVTTGYTSVVTALSSTAAVFNTTDVHHFLAQGWSPGAGHTITTQYGFRVGGLDEATTNIAFAGAVGATAGWNCYMTGLAPNYFGGEVRLGSQTDKGDYQLQVSTNPLLVDVVGSLFQLTGSPLPAISSGTIATFARSTSAGASAVISLISGNAAVLCGINFGDTDSETVGRLTYDHSTETFNWRVAGAAAMSLTSAELTLPATPAQHTNSNVAADTAYVDRAGHALSTGTNVLIPAAYGYIYPDAYEVTSGTYLELGAGAILEIT